MKLFQKWPELKLWIHTLFVIIAMYLLVGRGGYQYLIILPFALIHGLEDGYPSPEMKMFGIVLAVFFSLLILTVAWAIISLFARIITDQTKNYVFKTIFAASLLIIFSQMLFTQRIAQSGSRVTSAVFKGDIRAYEAAVKWRKSGNIDEDLYCAARGGQLQMVEYLISKGANPNAKLGGNGDSVLSGAIPNVMNKPDGNKLVVEYLQNHGATN